MVGVISKHEQNEKNNRKSEGRISQASSPTHVTLILSDTVPLEMWGETSQG